MTPRDSSWGHGSTSEDLVNFQRTALVFFRFLEWQPRCWTSIGVSVCFAPCAVLSFPRHREDKPTKANRS